MAATLRKKEPCACAGKGNNPLLGAGKKQETFTKRGKSGDCAKRGKHAPNANCGKTGSKCQEQENTQVGARRARANVSRKPETLTSLPPYISHNESWQCLRSNWRGICKDPIERMRWFLVSNFLTDFNCQSATMAGGTDLSFHVVSWLGTEHRNIPLQLIVVLFCLFSFM